MIQYLKLLVVFVPKYHWGIKIACNVPFQLKKEKTRQWNQLRNGKRTQQIYEETPKLGFSRLNLLHKFRACFCLFLLKNNTENFIFSYSYMKIVYENVIFTWEYAFAERCCFITFLFDGKFRKYVSMKNENMEIN